MTFVVKKNSWHYRWLANYTVARDIYRLSDLNSTGIADNAVDVISNKMCYRDRLPKDFCSYWRRVIVWPTLRIFFSNLPLAIMSIVLSTVGIQYTGIGLGAIMLAIAAIGAIATAAFFAIKCISTGTSKVISSIAETDFAETAYRSYKDNLCVLMEYEDEK